MSTSWTKIFVLFRVNASAIDGQLLSSATWLILHVSTPSCFIFSHSGALFSEVSHLDFLKQCGYQLTHACIQRRMTQEKSLQRDVRMAIEMCGYILTARRPLSLDGFLQKPKRCEFCPSSRDRKSKYVCWKCLKAICVEHSRKVCHNCASIWKKYRLTKFPIANCLFLITNSLAWKT